MTASDIVGDVLLVAAFFMLGAEVVRQTEGWAFLDAVYFWCITVSTVGFGDLSPATAAGKAFVSVYAPIGMVVVFSVVAKWASAVQSGLQAFYVRAMGVVGLYVLDVESMSIAEYTPDQVNERICYSRRYVLALTPLITLVAGFVAATLYFDVVPVAKPYDWTSFAEAVYFAVMTATTIGYGDDSFEKLRPEAKLAAALYVMLIVVVFANALSDMSLIRQRQRLRHGEIALPTLDDLEDILRAKAAAKGKARAKDLDLSEPGIDEADYVIATLKKGGLVDPQILLAVRRAYYWAARADGVGTRITESDLVALRIEQISAEGSRHAKDE